ncbi:MAG: DUF3035 domain-containing protein [Pseudomonadota bacterium]
MIRPLLLLAAASAALTACGTPRKNTPDEFAVITKPPLTVPPDYALRPPKPGEQQVQAPSSSERTQQLLLGDQRTEPPSNGELALIQRAGVLNVDPSIRATLASESGNRASKGESLANRILFWQVKNGEIDDSVAPLQVEDREAWLAQRASSISTAIGEDSEVVIARDRNGVLGLPGIR